MSYEQRYATTFAAIRADIEALVEDNKKLHEEIQELKKLLKADIKDTSTLEPIL